MKHTAHINYPNFIEVYDIVLTGQKLDIRLDRIEHEFSKLTGKTMFDFCDIDSVKSNYSYLGFQTGDCVVQQLEHGILIGIFSDTLQFVQIDTSDILQFIFDTNIFEEILPGIREDKEILINACLSDFIQNDFSYNRLNRKVKYLKIAVIVSYLKDILKTAYTKIILDETVLGDIEIEEIATCLRFSEITYLRAAKVNNIIKALMYLYKEGQITQKPILPDNLFILTNPNKGQKVKLVFGEDGLKFDYQINQKKNYKFEFNEKQYQMIIGGLMKEQVTGHLFVYNGDKNDLMIKDQ